MQSRFLLLFSCILSLSSFGQKFADSPFSSYGIGEFGNLDHPNFSAMGNTRTAVIDSVSLNYFNPASYSFLGNGQPLFSTGVSGKFSTFSENSAQSDNLLIGVNHFAFGLSFAKRFGFAFGLKPFSRTGYSLFEKEALGTDTIKYSYYGNGSVNEAFTGFSVKVLRFKNHQLGLGTNLAYLFGNSINQRTSNLTTLTSGGVEVLTYQVKSLHYEFGLNYTTKFGNNQNLNVGIVFSPAQAITASRAENLFFSKDVTNERFYKTVSSSYEKGKINLPDQLSLGFMYVFRPNVDSSYNKSKIFQLRLMGDFSSMNWSQYNTSFTADQSVARLLDTKKFSFGLEFSPHNSFLDRSKNIGYLSRIRYRAGVQYSTLPIERLSKQLSDRSVSLGFSFPIMTQRSVSSLNLGVVAGKRGNDDPASLNEKYIGVNFGVSIAPGAFDRWFRKYKID